MLPSVTIDDVLDIRRDQDGVTFVPAYLDFDDRPNVIEVVLFDDGTRDDPNFQRAQAACRVGDDPYSFPAIWLRSRIMAAFRVRPPVADASRPGLLEFPFLAALRGRGTALDVHPVVCSDGHNGLVLEFLSTLTPAGARSEITAAFRAWMLSDPLGLVPFDELCVQDCDYEWSLLWYGIARDGTAFEVDLIDGDPEDGPPGPVDDHLSFPGREDELCEACGGEGEESFNPAGERCDICGGTGRLNWCDQSPRDRKRPRRWVSRVFDRRS